MLNTVLTSASYLAAFIAAISILVTVHEFGHYWVAKKMGIKVLRFSVGFGKPLYTKKIGADQTEFVIAAFPLGGYVKMLDETEGDVSASETHRAFNQKSVAQRSAVVVAGPVFNLLFAVITYWAIFMAGNEGLRPVIGHVSDNSPASTAGFKVGDELLSVDNKEIKTWGHRRLYLFSQTLDADTVIIKVRSKAGHVRNIPLNLGQLSVNDVGPGLMERGIGIFVERPTLLAVIGELKEGPAKNAGMLAGDRITKINGKNINAWQDMAEIIHSSAGKQIQVTYLREKVLRTVIIIPKETNINGKTIGLISIAPAIPEIPQNMIRLLQYGPIEGLVESIDQTWTMSTMMLQMLYKMATLEVSAKNISGPITIAQYAGQSASFGILQFTVFLAAISISLGVLNLLPIPVLDGGHLMYYGIEAIKGSPVTDQARLWGQQAGMVILIMLMMLAFYNDIIRLISN